VYSINARRRQSSWVRMSSQLCRSQVRKGGRLWKPGMKGWWGHDAGGEAASRSLVAMKSRMAMRSFSVGKGGSGAAGRGLSRAGGSDTVIVGYLVMLC
jgi:hypothetical protein